MRHIPVLLLAATAACAQTLDLPAEPPAVERPSVTALAPDHGVAGTHVHVEGRSFGTSPRVRFGEKSFAAPLAVAADGTSLDVIVPEDAESGPVTVIADGLEGSFGRFDFEGVDHLREGRITRTIDLSAPFLSVLPLGERRYGLFAGFPMLAVVDQQRNLLAMPELHLGGVAVSRGASPRLVVLDLDAEARGACPHARGAVVAYDRAFTDEQHATTVCLTETPDLPGDPLLDVVVDGAGTRVVAWSARAAFLVDLAATPPTVRTATSGPGRAFERATWAGAARFAFLDAGQLRRLDFDTGVLTAEAEVEPFLDTDTLGTAADGRVLVGTDDGRVLVLADAWPPRVDATFDTGVSDPIVSVADSAASGRLAALQHVPGSTDRLLLFDLADGANAFPVAGTPIAGSPASVSRGVEGAFRVAVAGGYVAVSDVSGAVLENHAVHVDPLPPVPHRARDSQPFELLLASRTFDRTAAYVPGRGDLDPSAEFETRGPRSPIDAIAAARGTGPVFTQRGRELLHTLAEHPRTDLADRYAIPDGTFVTKLVASPDGREVAALTLAGAFVLDAAADWSQVVPPTFTLADEHVRLVLFDGPSRLVLAGEHTVRVLAADDARHGTERAAFPDTTFDATIVTAVAHPAGLLVVLADGHTWRIGADGARTDLGPGPWGSRHLAALEDAELVPTPGGRRVYWLETGYLEMELFSATLDVTTGEPLGVEPAITLPAGVHAFAFAEDGTHLVAIDADADRLYLLE